MTSISIQNKGNRELIERDGLFRSIDRIDRDENHCYTHFTELVFAIERVPPPEIPFLF